MFTTYPKCNKIAITQDGLNGTCIMNNLKTEKDLLKINKTILENASIYEYDNCFNEVEDLCDVFFQTIDNKITKLFQGINSSFFIAGPSRSGKSYTLFGTVKIKGVIAFSVDKILYYIDYMNNNVNNDNESENNEDNLNNENNEDNLNNENINNKLFLSLVIDQYYYFINSKLISDDYNCFFEGIT